MPAELLRSLVGAVAVLILLGLWAGSVVYVYWDTSRRNLRGWQQFTWVVVSLFPVVGLVAYVVAALVLFPAARDTAGDGRRITPLKRPPELRGDLEPRYPTIAAAEVARQATAAPLAPSARAATPYELLVLEGPHAGQRFSLQRLPAQIGRMPDSAIRLDRDGSVSRRHAEIYQHDGVLWLRDLQSAHGTLVNGARVSDAALAPGDRVEVGGSLLVVVAGSAGP